MDILLYYGGQFVDNFDAPIMRCTAQNGAFEVFADGPGSNGVGEPRIMLALDEGYAGPGTYQVTTADGLRAAVQIDQWQFAVAQPASECQLCVADDERTGIYRCNDLRNSAGATMHVLQGAWQCRP